MKLRSIQLPSDRDSSGRTFDKRESDNLKEVIESGTLNCTHGTWTKRFEERFAQVHRLPFVRALSSGTAAIHAAINAIDPEPGDEIITTAITDMGAITPILYQLAVPVFADIDPFTFNVSRETIEPKITKKTKAIIVTHLFGNPCEMGPILELAEAHRIPVIEDAAQSFLAEVDGKIVGSMGEIGCFSLQQGKHITTGEGGLVAAKEKETFNHLSKFVDKAWGYGEPHPDHAFLALNYRMTELQGAVGAAQVEKLEEVVACRIRQAERLTALIEGVHGVMPPKAAPNAKHTYWKYCLKIDPMQITGGVDRFSQVLKERFSIPSAPGYIKKPAFECALFQHRKTFGQSGYPLVDPVNRTRASYDRAGFPGTIEALNTILVLPWNERYTDEHVDFLAEAIHETAKALRNG